VKARGVDNKGKGRFTAKKKTFFVGNYELPLAGVRSLKGKNVPHFG
jgi:hypothetical protein